MKQTSRPAFNAALLIALLSLITIASARLHADTGVCGGGTTTLPFTDVPSSNIFFCSIASAFFTGLTNGTTPTTYSPGDSVLREQMAAFVSRTMDQSLKRGSRRASHDQYWAPTSPDGLGLTAIGDSPTLVKSDGADLWVADNGAATVSRVRASDGRLLETWTDATGVIGVLPAKGLIFATGQVQPGLLFQIDPTQPAGAVTVLPISLGNSPNGISFDGARIWTANLGASISIVSFNPLSVNTVTAGFTHPSGIVSDGTNMWITDHGTFPAAGNLFKLDSNGAIIQTVPMGVDPRFLVFDGTNLWVPNGISNTVTVVRASTGAVLATLTGNGLGAPTAAAFDGERILVTNSAASNSVSLWKAADLTPLGSVSTGPMSFPFGACSDGLNFWITLQGTAKLARF